MLPPRVLAPSRANFGPSPVTLYFWSVRWLMLSSAAAVCSSIHASGSFGPVGSWACGLGCCRVRFVGVERLHFFGGLPLMVVRGLTLSHSCSLRILTSSFRWASGQDICLAALSLDCVS